MSGRKYSQAMVDNAIREAIHCRVAAEQALEGASSLVAGLELATQLTEALRPFYRQACATMEKLKSEVEGAQVSIDQAKLASLTPMEIARRRDAMRRARSELETIAAGCREANAAAGMVAEISRIGDIVERGSENLEPWTRDRFDAFANSVARLRSETIAEVTASGAARGFEERIRSISADLEKMERIAGDRRTMAAEREYIAEALTRVCSSALGFAVRRLPQSGPLEDLVLEVDTFAFGLIHFRLQLDGMIRSQSPLVAASCPSNFKLIEERLRSMGVLATFRYESDQSPVTLTSDAKEVPADSPGQRQREAV